MNLKRRFKIFLVALSLGLVVRIGQALKHTVTNLFQDPSYHQAIKVDVIDQLLQSYSTFGEKDIAYEDHENMIARRCLALNKAKNGKIYEKNFSLEPEVIKLLKSCGVNTPCVSSFKGNAAQRELHKEYIQIIQDLDYIYKQSISPQWLSVRKEIIEILDLGLEGNREGKLSLSYKAADWCWKAVDILNEALEGSFEEAEKMDGGVMVAFCYRLLPLSNGIMKTTGISPNSNKKRA